MRAGFRSAWRALASLPSRHPLAFGSVLSSVKTAGSDYVTQKWVEGRQEIDKRRNLVFFTWGLLYLGGVQYFLFCKLFAERLFPSAAAFAAKPLRAKLADRAGQATVLKQVFLDQFVHHPFVFFPLFYQLKDFIEGGSPEQAFQKYRKNLAEDVLTLWSIWIPGQIFNFAICPVWMRIPFVAVVSSGYTCLMSSMRGARECLDDVSATASVGTSEFLLVGGPAAQQPASCPSPAEGEAMGHAAGAEA